MDNPGAEEVPIDQIIQEKDDFALCNGVFLSIMELRENWILVPDMPIEEETVSLTWHVGGILGNGGFRFLFEGLFPDKNYQRTIEAFRRVGCEGHARVLERAVALYPGGQIPPVEYQEEESFSTLVDKAREQEERFLSLPEVVRRGLDEELCRAYSDLFSKLAAYIRSHREGYAHLPPAVLRR